MSIQVLDGERSGLGLPDMERVKLMELKKELSQLCLEFSVSDLSTASIVTWR